MATENVRLGVDSRPAVAGFQRYENAAAKAIGKTWSLNAVVGTLAGSFGALAAGRAIGTAIRGMVEFDSAMTQSLSIMGDVDSMMRDRMASAAREVGQALNFGAEQGAEAFFFLASAGLDAEQSIAALPAVAEFARAGMFDFATATDLATDAQSALGLGAESAAANLQGLTRVTDVLVKANTLANASVEQFAASLTNEAGAALRSFNIDVEEGVAVLAAFADQGVKGNVAGANLSRILRLMTSAAVANGEAFADLGVRVFDASGDVNNMADIIGDLEQALGGMSDAQRIAALESIGFQARVQGALLPLLGTSDAIRDYEAELRNAAGTTGALANNQMKSLQNEIGKVQVRFVNWRTEVAESTIPAILWAIENIDMLTDSAIALATAIGIAGATAAFVVFGPAVVASTSAVLAAVAAVRSLSGAVMLLHAAMGPTGWLILGVTALAGVLYTFRSRAREAAEETRAMAAAMDEAVVSISALNKEATLASMAQFRQGFLEASEEVRNLQAELDALRAAPATGLGASQAAEIARVSQELAVAQERQAGLERLASATAERWEEISSAATEAGNAPPPGSGGGGSGGAAETALLLEGLRLRVLASDEVQELMRRQDRLNTALKAGVSSLEERVKLTKEVRDIERELAERWYPRTAIAMGTINAGLNLQLETLGKMEPLFGRARDDMEGVGDAAVEGANRAQQAWSAALGAISTGVGGVVGQIASIGQAFLAGGPIGGIAAMGGMMLGQVFGGGGGRERAEQERRMAEEARNAADALAELTRAVSNDLSVRGLSVGGQTQEAEALRFRQQQEEERRRMEAQSGEAFGGRSIAQVFQEALGGDLSDWTLEAIREVMDSVNASTFSADFRAYIEEYLRLLDVQAAELEAFNERQAKRQAQAQADFNTDLAVLEATVGGDELGARIAEINAGIRKQVERYEELYRAGVITEEQLARISEVLGIKLVQDIDAATEAYNAQSVALRDSAAAAREAAAAERERQAVDLMSLEVRFLRAQGLDREAQLMQAHIEMQRAMNEGRSSEYLHMLEMTLALEAQGRATSTAARGADDLSRSLARATASMNVPQINWNFLRSFSAERAGIIGGSGSTGTRTTYNLGGITVVAAPGQDPRELWASIKTAIEQDAQDGDSSAFRSLEFN